MLTSIFDTRLLHRPSQLLQFTGILVLGVGDAMVVHANQASQYTMLTHVLQASIVGKKLGKHRWSATTSKTLEGSVAFTLSIVAFACVLRMCGVVEQFSVRYSARVNFVRN
jgi:dolichol kinase